jgi:DNA-binding NarL/FixJ family response regulator
MSSVEILIADDRELFRRMVRSLVESQPNCHICGEAGDGIETIEKVRQLRPDIVLTDINMPRMNGLQATRVIRSEAPECNVIIVTQNDAAVAREQARGANAQGFVTKSDLARDLLPTIRKIQECEAGSTRSEDRTRQNRPMWRGSSGK